jgi:hypothetical protein
MRGDFPWLAASPELEQHIGREKAAENIHALASLRESLKRLGLKQPESFTAFMDAPALHARIRSTTDCLLDICPEAVQSPISGGYLVRFLADSQGCLFWYLYLTADGSDHAVVASPGSYGTEAEQWQEEPPATYRSSLRQSASGGQYENHQCRQTSCQTWFEVWKDATPANIHSHIWWSRRA